LLASYRSDGAGDGGVIRAALSLGGEGPVEVRDLPLGPLSADEARTLAGLHLGESGGGAERQAEAVAAESGGNPFFVAELARSAHDREPAGGRPLVSLDEVLWSRVAALPPDARGLLEVVSVAGVPLNPAVAWRCFGREGDERASVSLLRSGRLLRTTGGAGDPGLVEAYHDRVRETVVGRLAADDLREHHRRLALALEAAGGCDPEVLATHYQGAGDGEAAAGHYVLAAARAAEALAFERASTLYRRALDLRPAGHPGATRLRASLAESLANAGRGAESAREYLAAGEGASVALALEYRRRAAMQFLISGHIDQGLDTLRLVLASIGLDLPRTPARALASLLVGRARLWVRGLRFRPRDTSEVAAADLTRVDVCWSASVGLSNVDWVRGADFHARCLRLALRAGEPSRVARALAVEAAQSATAGRPARRRTARLLDRAAGLARSSGDPYSLGMVTLAGGVSSYLEGRWADALSLCDRAEAELRDNCKGVAWELDTAHAYALWSLSHLGRWGELARRFPVLVNEARERGDLYAVMNLSTYILSVVRLAADDPGSARVETQRVSGQWSREGYHVQHNDLVWAWVQTDLYAGDGAAAADRLARHWPTLARSLLLKVQFIRVAMLGLRARCALARGAGDRDSFRPAARDADRLSRERHPWADAQAATARAAVALRRGRRGEAAELLRLASARYTSCGMSLCAAVSDRRLGETLGGPEGRSLVDRADALISSQAVLRPDRVAAMYAPGFD
jgi:hypothetical protein